MGLMMAEKTPIDAGLIARVSGAFKVLTGQGVAVDSGAWFGPQNPPPPVVSPSQQPSVVGRQFDYPVGYNLQYRPRAYEAVTFQQMRALADGCDVLRLVIETRKDQIAKMRYKVRLRGDDKKSDARCDQIMEFFRRPDGENTWTEWLRMLMEEMLVTDAATIYPWLTNGGKPYRFELLDGTTIKRVIDARGRTPAAPFPAYQQILKGLPAVDYTADELVYATRNMRVSKVYGMSPVEQIVMTVNIAIRRSLHQLQYYTDGSTPDLLFQVPADWNMTQIKDFNDWWQDSLSGNTANRRKAQFVPSGVTPVNTKDAILKDGYDEWLTRIICYCFSVSPQAFVKDQNRATADTAQQQALEEGLYPMMDWVKGVIDDLILKYFGYSDIEFYWDSEKVTDAEVQARIDDMSVKNGTKSINEIRAKRGDDPVEGGDVPMVMTGMGYVPIVKPEVEELPEPTPPTDPTAPKPDNQAKEETAKIEKAKKSVKPINRDTPKHKKNEAALAKGLKAIFKDQLSKITIKLSKSEDDPLEGIKFSDWEAYNDLFTDTLTATAKLGTTTAYAQIGLDDEESLTLANENAVEWAKKRSAELVGKKITKDGQIIDNPNADYSIDESTREMLRADITRAMEEGMSNDELADLLSDNYAFSDERAETIARTETANADCAGNEILYKESGVVSKKEWIVGAGCCDDCEMLNGEIVDIDENFSNGEMVPPAHPNCVLPDTVVCGANVKQYFKHQYDGLVFQITTGDDRPLNVTANHPILTLRGWVPAKDILVGDTVIKTADQDIAIGTVDERQHIMPVYVESAFEYALWGDEPESIKGDKSQFHGDGDDGLTLIAKRNYKGVENNMTVITDEDLSDAEKRKTYGNLQIIESVVSSVISFEYVGEVYNIETEGGWFFAENFVTHNCRCDFLPVLSDED